MSAVGNMDASSNTQQKAKRTAWCSHVESNIGDLVAYAFYSLDDNFGKLTSHTMASMLPFPQRYYVPERIREMHRPRLEAAGLWTHRGSEPAKDSFGKRSKMEDPKDEYARAFERDRVSAQAKASFDLYARLLNGQTFFSGVEFTTLDIHLASHILLLLDPPFPDQMMRNILEQSYPTLIEHARNVQAAVSRIPPYPIAPAQKHSLLSLISRTLSNPIEKKESPLDETDIRFRRMRWVWSALAFGGVACYVVQLYMHTVIIGVNGKPLHAYQHEMDETDETVAANEVGSDENGVQGRDE